MIAPVDSRGASMAPCRPEPKILPLFDDQPALVGVREGGEAFQAFLPILDPMVGEVVVTLQELRMVTDRHRERGTS